MRFRKLDLNLLAALDTLIRTRNVSRAAEEMHLTQSAMSNALARLRDHFGDALLVPVGRRMELTALGETLCEPVRDIIVRIGVAMEITPSFDPAASTRRFGIVLSDYTMNLLMPAFLKRLAQRAPQIRIDLQPQNIFPHRLLESGEADLLITLDLYASPTHPSQPLWEDRLCCVVDADSSHPHRRFTRAAFEAAGHVTMLPPRGGESYAMRACREKGLKVRSELTTYAFASMGVLVRGTERVAIVQKRLARRLVAQDRGLRIVGMPVALPPLHEAVQWHSARAHDPALSWVREQLIAAVDED